jgi:transposase
MPEQEEPTRKKRTTYSQQFKLDAVKLVIEGSRSVNDVANNLGVSPGTLRLWKHTYEREHGVANRAFPGKGNLSPEEEELRRVKRERDQAIEERDILKKALAFFSRTEE